MCFLPLECGFCDPRPLEFVDEPSGRSHGVLSFPAAQRSIFSIKIVSRVVSLTIRLCLAVGDSLSIPNILWKLTNFSSGSSTTKASSSPKGGTSTGGRTLNDHSSHNGDSFAIARGRTIIQRCRHTALSQRSSSSGKFGIHVTVLAISSPYQGSKFYVRLVNLHHKTIILAKIERY